jgi:hypothetical protein
VPEAGRPMELMIRSTWIGVVCGQSPSRVSSERHSFD